MTAVVELSGVGKQFTKYEDAPMLVTAALRVRQRTRRSTLWAVRGVDLSLPEGECLGIIGRNGSGKSTLLSMLAGVTAPTEGSVSVRGRVAPLISVGVGFHPELTGRENVYVNGMILGMTRRDLDRSLDEIVAFAELEEFLDTPVKFYSSGMFVRLGFAVAVQSRPDVLLVDEVLAVGDLAFQLKCYDRMLAIRDAGTSIVVVSHNLNAVRLMCTRTGVMAQGALRFLGATTEAISVYHDLLGETRELDPGHLGTVPARRAGVASIDGVELLGGDGRPTRHLAGGDRIVVRAHLRVLAPVEDPYFGVAVVADTGAQAYTDSTRELLPRPLPAGGEFTVEVALRAGLVTGSYTIQVGLNEGVTAQLATSPPLPFFVSSRPAAAGVADLEGSFRLL